MRDRILFKQEGYAAIGGCLEVYKEKGNGFLEAVCRECLSMELHDQQIPFVEKPRHELE